MKMIEMGQRARSAARQLARATTQQKNAALLGLAEGLLAAAGNILDANQADLAAGEGAGLTPALLDRLLLNEERLEGIARDLRGLADLPDPVGEIFDAARLPNGLAPHEQGAP